MHKKIDKHLPLPYPIYYAPVVILCLLGIATSLYLSVSHYKNYTDTSYSSFCAISKAINCDTVSQSSWSILLGLPVAYWGVIGYLLFLVILIPLRTISNRTKSLWSILFILAFLFSSIAILFGYISSVKIHAYCIMCLLSYGVSFSLLFYSWFIRRRFDDTSFSNSLKKAGQYIAKSKYIHMTFMLLSTITLCLILILPSYWHFEIPPLNENISSGTTNDGHPWIGAETPTIVIKEFTDYQCFQCYKMHLLLRQLLTKYPNKIRLIHYNYPMDHEFNSVIVPEPFHIGSGKMALLGIYAMTQKKFWEANDILYQLGQQKEPFEVTVLAEAINIPSADFSSSITRQNIRSLLRNDIRVGGMAGITGTPSYIIEGKVYEGSIPQDILKRALK